MWSRNNKITELLRELSQQNLPQVLNHPHNSLSPSRVSEQQQQSCATLIEDINYIQQCYVTREDNVFHMRVFLMQVLDTGGNKSAGEIKQAIQQIQILEKHRQIQEDEIISKYESFKGTQQPIGSMVLSGQQQQSQPNNPNTQSSPSLIKILCYKIFSKITKLSSAYLSKIQLFFPKLFEILLPEQLQLSNALKEAQQQLISSSSNFGLSLGRVFARIASAGRIKLQREILRLQSFQSSQLQTLGQEKHRNKQNERFYSDKHMQGVQSLKYVIGLQKKFFLKTTLHPKKQGKQQNASGRDIDYKKEQGSAIAGYIDGRVEQQPLEDILFVEKKSTQQSQSVTQSGNEHESILEVILGSYDRQLKEWMHSNRSIHVKIKVYSNQINNISNNNMNSNGSKNIMNITSAAITITPGSNQPNEYCNKSINSTINTNKDPKISLLLYSPRLSNTSYQQKPKHLTVTTPKLIHPYEKQQQPFSSSSSSAQSFTVPQEDISPLQKQFPRFPHSSKELMSSQQVDRYGDVYDYEDDTGGYDNSIRSMEITDKTVSRDGTASTNSTVNHDVTDQDKYHNKTGYYNGRQQSFMLSTSVAPTKSMAKLINTSSNLVPRYSVLSAETQQFQQPSMLKNLLKTQENNNNINMSNSNLRQSNVTMPSNNHAFIAKSKHGCDNNNTSNTTLTRLTSLDKNSKTMGIQKTSQPSYQQRSQNSQQLPISNVAQLCNGSAPFSLVYEQSLLLSQQLKLKQNKRIPSDEAINISSTRKSSSSSSKQQLQIVATKFFTLQSAQKAVTNQAMKGMMNITGQENIQNSSNNNITSFNGFKIKKEQQPEEEFNMTYTKEENMKNKKNQKNQVSWYGESVILTENDKYESERHTQSEQIPSVSPHKPPIQEFRRLQLNEVAKQIDNQIQQKQQQQQQQLGYMLQEQHSPMKSAREQIQRTTTSTSNYSTSQSTTGTSSSSSINPPPLARFSPASSFFFPAKSVGNGYLRATKKDSTSSNLSSELQNQVNLNNTTTVSNSNYKGTNSSTVFLVSDGRKPLDVEQIPVGNKIPSNHSSSSSHRIMNLTRDSEVSNISGEQGEQQQQYLRSTEITKTAKTIRNHKNNNNMIPAKTSGGSSIRVGGYLSSPLIGSPPLVTATSSEATDIKPKLTFHFNKDIQNPQESIQSAQKNFVISPARKLLTDGHSGLHSFYSLHSQTPADSQISQVSQSLNTKGLFSATNLERSMNNSSKQNLQNMQQQSFQKGTSMQVSK